MARRQHQIGSAFSLYSIKSCKSLLELLLGAGLRVRDTCSLTANSRRTNLVQPTILLVGGQRLWEGSSLRSPSLKKRKLGYSNSAYFISTLHGRKGKEPIFFSTVLVAWFGAWQQMCSQTVGYKTEQVTPWIVTMFCVMESRTSLCVVWVNNCPKQAYPVKVGSY